jgi:hypothetical protein
MQIRVLLRLTVFALVFATGVEFVSADEAAKRQFLETKSCPGCDLTGVELRGRLLDGSAAAQATVRANLIGATLIRTSMAGVHLKGALLTDAKLVEAHLQNADLTDAIMNNADLTRADLEGARLDGAKMYGIDLTDTVFEPASLPDVQSLVNAKGLKSLKWKHAPTMVIALRNKFKEAGMTREERQVVYSIMRGESATVSGVEQAFGYVLLELTTEWGVAPWRPLWILIALIPFFSMIYAGAIMMPPARGGIWRVWDKDRIEPALEHEAPTKLTIKNCRALTTALYFSVLSAFFVGWHEVNIGSWINRLSPREATLRGTGWVRTVSGVQSLVSVFLLALWIVCYFGRPFE